MLVVCHIKVNWSWDESQEGPEAESIYCHSTSYNKMTVHYSITKMSIQRFFYKNYNKEQIKISRNDKLIKTSVVHRSSIIGKIGKIV